MYGITFPSGDAIPSHWFHLIPIVGVPYPGGDNDGYNSHTYYKRTWDGSSVVWVFPLVYLGSLLGYSSTRFCTNFSGGFVGRFPPPCRWLFPLFFPRFFFLRVAACFVIGRTWGGPCVCEFITFPYEKGGTLRYGCIGAIGNGKGKRIVWVSWSEEPMKASRIPTTHGGHYMRVHKHGGIRYELSMRYSFLCVDEACDKFGS